jgi:hypothetical protein
MNEALSSSETSALTRATRCNIPEDAILHSHHRENLKSYRDESSSHAWTPFDLALRQRCPVLLSLGACLLLSPLVTLGACLPLLPPLVSITVFDLYELHCDDHAGEVQVTIKWQC